MISERLNTREAGDLMDEINAHRLRSLRAAPGARHPPGPAGWMPEVRPAQPLAVDPDATLDELLEAMHQGGREAYRRLIWLLAELKTLEGGSELLHQALAELSRAQGAVLGNVGVYVDASVDPETLRTRRRRLPKRWSARDSSPTRCAAKATACRYYAGSPRRRSPALPRRSK